MGSDQHGPAYPEPPDPHPGWSSANETTHTKGCRLRWRHCRTCTCIADKPPYRCPICNGGPNRYMTCDYPGCPDGRDQSGRFRSYSNESPPLRAEKSRGLVGWACFLALLVYLMWPHPSQGMQHGFDPGSATTQWFERQKIPPVYEVSCCGKGDGYPVDRYELLPDGSYRVWIEDGSAMKYPDGTTRLPWDENVTITVAASSVNREDDDLDNPSDHGWIFFMPEEAFAADGSLVPSTRVINVYCFIRHPQGN